MLVWLVPRVIYHSNEEFFLAFNPPNQKYIRNKREPITTITLAGLLRLGTTGARTGITSLVLQEKHYRQLKEFIDLDIQRLERSVSNLEQNVDSLAEVVLQNRRRFNLLLLQQGGLCTILKGECCFYANRSGIIRESLAKVREGLEKRHREREARSGLFESWINASPWLRALISILLSSFTFLILLVTFGLCLLNKLSAYIKQRVGVIQLMLLRSQYQRLAIEENNTNQ